jgi:TolB protein
MTLLLSAALSACGSSTEPVVAGGSGTIELNVATTGTDLDSDGYRVAIDGAADQPVATNGTVTVSAEAGAHTIAITGLAFNCDVTTNPGTAAVTAGQTTHADVRVTCGPFLRNAIIYSSQAFGLPEVAIMKPDGSRSQRLTTDQSVYVSPAVSPDGQTIAATSQSGGTWNGIYLLDRFGKGRTKFPGNSPSDNTPVWSPDGTKLAFQSEIRGALFLSGRVFVANRDGSGLRQVSPETADYSYDTGAAWSPDGTRILYSHTSVLTVINADGTGVRSLGVNGMQPSWSPDGSRIAYTWYVGGIVSIFVADPNGANARQLTTPAEGDQDPQWSPDGRQLVFGRTEAGATHLYRIAADGSGLMKLSVVAQAEYGAKWTPNF